MAATALAVFVMMAAAAFAVFVVMAAAALAVFMVMAAAALAVFVVMTAAALSVFVMMTATASAVFMVMAAVAVVFIVYLVIVTEVFFNGPGECHKVVCKGFCSVIPFFWVLWIWNVILVDHLSNLLSCGLLIFADKAFYSFIILCQISSPFQIFPCFIIFTVRKEEIGQIGSGSDVGFIQVTGCFKVSLGQILIPAFQLTD